MFYELKNHTSNITNWRNKKGIDQKRGITHTHTYTLTHTNTHIHTQIKSTSPHTYKGAVIDRYFQNSTLEDTDPNIDFQTMSDSERV